MAINIWVVMGILAVPICPFIWNSKFYENTTKYTIALVLVGITVWLLSGMTLESYWNSGPLQPESYTQF